MIESELRTQSGNHHAVVVMISSLFYFMRMNSGLTLTIREFTVFPGASSVRPIFFPDDFHPSCAAQGTTPRHQAQAKAMVSEL